MKTEAVSELESLNKMQCEWYVSFSCQSTFSRFLCLSWWPAGLTSCIPPHSPKLVRHGGNGRLHIWIKILTAVRVEWVQFNFGYELTEETGHLAPPLLNIICNLSFSPLIREVFWEFDVATTFLSIHLFIHDQSGLVYTCPTWHMEHQLGQSESRTLWFFFPFCVHGYLWYGFPHHILRNLVLLKVNSFWLDLLTEITICSDCLHNRSSLLEMYLILQLEISPSFLCYQKKMF